MSEQQRVRVIGGGLAGCEAALQLASRGFKVDLYEMRPVRQTPAHKDGHLAQLVCSNSFKALGITSAHGLLKQELTMLGSFLLDSAREAAVPAGDSLTVNRDIFSESVLVTDKVIEDIASLSDIAPLHNPAHVLGLKAVKEVLPNVPQVAVFDTSFHQTMKPEAYIYALPYEFYTDYKIRKYGYHGASHRYVTERLRELYPAYRRVISCHLGNGASLCAVLDGKCVDTTMGLTPLGGIMMGTRCGNIDPAIIPYLQNTTGMTADEIDYIMNNKSGLLGLSGVSSDLRDVEAAAAAGNYRAQIALDLFVYTAATYIAAVTVSLGGLDAIIFTAGIGENDPGMRKMICDRLKHFGVEIDDKINNEVRRRECSIASLDSKIGIFVIPTNEELIVARDTYKLIRSLKGDDLDD